MTTKTIKERYFDIKQRIESTQEQSPVQLIAVSKKKPVEDIQALHQLGQRSFGESYPQEFAEKAKALHELPIEWHFVGPIQSNKTKLIAEHAQWVQSVDRIKIAQRLNDQRPNNLSPLNVCIQINIDDEPQKSGVTPENLDELANYIVQQPNLTLRGLMCLPKRTKHNQILEQSFRSMYALYLQLKQTHPDVDTLSMGMSSDLELAIQQGSTMVRVGQALFGSRT